MENFIAVSYASAGTSGCGQVRANGLKRAFPCFLLSPSFACEILEGGRCKTTVFYSFIILKAPPIEIPWQQ